MTEKKEDDRQQRCVSCEWTVGRQCVPHPRLHWNSLHSMLNIIIILRKEAIQSPKYHTCDSAPWQSNARVLWTRRTGCGFLSCMDSTRWVAICNNTNSSLVCCDINSEPQMIILALTTGLNQAPGNLIHMMPVLLQTSYASMYCFRQEIGGRLACMGCSLS